MSKKVKVSSKSKATVRSTSGNEVVIVKPNIKGQPIKPEGGDPGILSPKEKAK